MLDVDFYADDLDGTIYSLPHGVEIAQLEVHISRNVDVIKNYFDFANAAASYFDVLGTGHSLAGIEAKYRKAVSALSVLKNSLEG